MECAICFNVIKKSAVGLCNHHFCFHCLVRWCHFSTVCPKCKTNITEIKFDPEYDILVKELCRLNVDVDKIGNDIANSGGSGGSVEEVFRNGSGITNVVGGGNIKEIVVTFNNSKEVGLTVANNSDGPGVIISRIDRYGRGFICGLKKGNVLLFINNVPCINHMQCINIFKECMYSNKNAVCMIF